MREEIGGRLGVERVDSLRVVPRSPLPRHIWLFARVVNFVCRHTVSGLYFSFLPSIYLNTDSTFLGIVSSQQSYHGRALTDPFNQWAFWGQGLG